MEELLQRLRKFYFRTFVPTLIIIGVVCIVFYGRESYVDPMTTYKLMVALFGLTFVAFAATSFSLHRARNKCNEVPDSEKAAIYEKPYKIRIITLTALSLISCVVFAITSDTTTIYLVGMMLLLILLSYPSHAFVSKP